MADETVTVLGEQQLKPSRSSGEATGLRHERGYALLSWPSEPWSLKYYLSLRGSENVQVV
jgi:hypothetical protein